MASRIETIRQLISEELLERQEQQEEFVPGKTWIQTGQAFYDDREIMAVVESLLSGWLGLAEKSEEFGAALAERFNRSHGLFANSGSSANLLALKALKDRYGLQGGEVITPACAFPTTFNPIVQCGFTPVVVDIDASFNIDVEAVFNVVNDRTAGIVFSHILGNPADMDTLCSIAREKGLFILEDCCEAMGSQFGGRLCGTFGDVATFSFYASHNMTTGEGGACCTDDREIFTFMQQYRDWGRAAPAAGNESKKDTDASRDLDYNCGGIRYDRSYVYEKIGYNMKPLELQAAMGMVQLDGLDGFNALRRRNYQLYREAMEPLQGYLNFPKIHPGADPVFFGFPLIINDDSIDRRRLALFLLEHRIDTRFLFTGNILKHPAYRGIDYRQCGTLQRSDAAMKKVLWTGIHPGISEAMIACIAEKMEQFFKGQN